MTERVLGLDPGERRIGVAISDPLGIIAQPLVVIDRQRDDALAAIRNLVSEHNVSMIVVGLPISLSGDEGQSAVAARAFATEIAENVECQVEHMDERFTSAIAEEAMLEGGVRRQVRRDSRDKIAAAVMLQGWLDRERRTDK